MWRTCISGKSQGEKEGSAREVGGARRGDKQYTGGVADQRDAKKFERGWNSCKHCSKIHKRRSKSLKKVRRIENGQAENSWFIIKKGVGFHLSYGLPLRVAFQNWRTLLSRIRVLVR